MNRSALAVVAVGSLALAACSPEAMEQIKHDMRTVSTAITTPPPDAEGGSVNEATARASGFTLDQVVRGTLREVGAQGEFKFQGEKGQELVMYGQLESGYGGLDLYDSSGFGHVAHVYVSGGRPLESVYSGMI
nr:hypothetical protein [Gemmatimonadota bacterium]